MSTNTQDDSNDAAYTLTESQHYALYRARHLLEMLSSLANAREEFTQLRRESIDITCGLIAELMDSATPDLIWRKPV